MTFIVDIDTPCKKRCELAWMSHLCTWSSMHLLLCRLGMVSVYSTIMQTFKNICTTALISRLTT